MDTTKERTERFVPIQRKLTIEDFQKMAKAVAEMNDDKATPLFHHRKSIAELAYHTYDMWIKGFLFVYATDDDPITPIGVLACSIAELWWIDGKVLSEDLVVGFGPNSSGFGRFAVDALEKIALENACSLILSGSSMVNKSEQVTNLYKKKGFVVYGVSYLKEVTA